MKREQSKDIYRRGYDSGASCVLPANFPDIGEITLFDGKYVVVTPQNMSDVYQFLAFKAEENSRQFSPFEFTAKEFNEMEYSEEVWDIYDSGVAAGIRDAVNALVNEILED